MCQAVSVVGGEARLYRLKSCHSSQKGSPRAVWWRGVVARRAARASERGHHQPAMTGGGGGPAKATSSALHVLEQVVMGTLSEMSASNLVTVTATLTPGVTALTQGRPQIK